MPKEQWEDINLKASIENISGLLIAILSMVIFVLMFCFSIQINFIMFLATVWWLTPILLLFVGGIVCAIIYYMSKIIGDIIFQNNSETKKRTAVTILIEIIVILTDVYCCFYMNSINQMRRYDADMYYMTTTLLNSVLAGAILALLIQIFNLSKHKDKFEYTSMNEYRHSLDRLDDFRK